MRNIFLIVKNNLYRTIKDKTTLVMVLIIMPLVISFGVYFSSTDILKGKIAVVGASIQEEAFMENFNGEKLKVEFLENEPTKTELIKGVYLAEVSFLEEEPKVISYGNEEVKKTLEASLKGETYISEVEQTSVQGKVIGFLVMFCFMGASSMMMDCFLTDRENGTYTRVLSGGVTYFQYLWGQIIYAVIAFTLTSTVWTMALLKLLNANITIGYGTLFSVLMIMGILSSAFGILIATIFKDKTTSSMSGSIITMVTCLFGGCIVNIQDTNKLVGVVRDLIPQKRLIDLANNFNNMDLIYLVVVIIIFVLISFVVGKKQYNDGIFV